MHKNVTNETVVVIRLNDPQVSSSLTGLVVNNYKLAMKSIVPFKIEVAPIINTRESAIHKIIFLCSKIAKASESQTKNSHSD